MRRFTEKFLIPYIATSGYRRLCEIGSQGGSNIDRLLQLKSVEITTIDPCIDMNLEEKYRDNPRMHVLKGLSLNMLPKLEGAFDCIMIDGDHNWYSVYHELQLVYQRKLLDRNGTILFHDVRWPYARRDMYYDLNNVPIEYQQPSAQKGVLRGVSTLSEVPGEGKNPDLWNAVHEGGPRNGVLTAIEDFIKVHPDTFEFFSIEREWGLGVLTFKGASPKGLAKLKLQSWLYKIQSAITGK